MIRAVLLDVFNTVLTVDFDAGIDDMVALSGLTEAEWDNGFRAYGDDITVGAVTLEDAFADIFRLAGKSPKRIQALVQRDLELLQDHATLYPDVIPFIEEIRGRSIRVAFVSNCAANTGPLLEALGLAALADHISLSCDVGSAKPDPAIYHATLAGLNVAPGDALFVDDKAAYCSGAESIGMTAVRIDRHSKDPAAVRTLRDVLPMI